MLQKKIFTNIILVSYEKYTKNANILSLMARMLFNRKIGKRFLNVITCSKHTIFSNALQAFLAYLSLEQGHPNNTFLVGSVLSFFRY